MGNFVSSGCIGPPLYANKETLPFYSRSVQNKLSTDAKRSPTQKWCRFFVLLIESPSRTDDAMPYDRPNSQLFKLFGLWRVLASCTRLLFVDLFLFHLYRLNCKSEMTQKVPLCYLERDRFSYVESSALPPVFITNVYGYQPLAHTWIRFLTLETRSLRMTSTSEASVFCLCIHFLY